MLVFGVISVASPGDVLGATTSKTAKCAANLRTSASTSARAKALIASGTKVSVVATVTGGSYRTSCLGTPSRPGRGIGSAAINGRSVSSLYGVNYLYGATSLFKTTPYTRYAACTINLRTKPSTSSTTKRQIVAEHEGPRRDDGEGQRHGPRIAAARSSPAHPGIGSARQRADGQVPLWDLVPVRAGGPVQVDGQRHACHDARHDDDGKHGHATPVSSIPALLSALADDSVGQIVVANGTYHVSTSSSQHSDALWIGSRYASRTRPVIVRAATTAA